MDKIDTIASPAMLVPSSISFSDYVNINANEREDIRFYSVPYEFLCRDKWTGIHKQGEAARSDGVNIHEYEQANAEGRVLLLTTLHNLLTNRDDDEDGDDGDLESSKSDSESIHACDIDSDSDSGSTSGCYSGSGSAIGSAIGIGIGIGETTAN
jgi:hypothetical protein